MRHSLRTLFLVVINLVTQQILNAQAIPDTTTARQTIFAEVSGLGSSASQTPFWFRSRQYGIVPLSSPAGILRAGINKQFGDYQNPHKALIKIGFEGVANIGTNSRLILPVAYASVLLGKFELYGGRRREVFGLVDTLLTSGSYAWSGNALPIYKIQLATRGYVPIGFTQGILAINALYAHGWFSDTDSIQNSFLHQKALFARVNLFKGKVRLYGGLTHYTQWGGHSTAGNYAINGRIPSSFKDYLNVVFVQRPLADTTQYTRFDSDNQVGNHLGSMDIALEIDSKRSNWFLYYQHAYEDKSGVVLKNMPDGLYGIRWKNRSISFKRRFRLTQMTAELLTTMDQGGFYYDTGSRLYNGADDYFNNYQFVDGWTHKKQVIGTPLFTRWLDSRPDLHNLKGGYVGNGPMMISNNRVQMGHFGLSGQWKSGIRIRSLLSISRNWGRPLSSDPRSPLSQFSGMIELVIPTHWLNGADIKLATAIDQGQWLTNNTGGWVSIKKFLQKR